MSRIVKRSAWVAVVDTFPGELQEDRPASRDRNEVAAVFASAEVMRLASQRADALLQAASKKAAALVAKAESQARELAKKAYQEGFAQGRKEGLEAGRAEATQSVMRAMESHFTSLDKAVADIVALRREILREAEPELVKFAARIAEKIVRREFAQPEATADLARSLLAEVEDESRITVYLPEAVAQSPDLKRRLQEGVNKHLSVAADPALQPGDVRIETQWGWVDGRLQLRWERLMRAFEEAVVSDEVD